MTLSDTSQRSPCRRALARGMIAVALVALLVPTGCVRRRLAVRSNPPGALVFVDNQHIGTTPCSVDFTYYGTREIRLVKPGFETLTVNQPIPTPWYQIPPLDFVSENMVPNTIEDHRTVAFDLQPQIIVPTEQLLDRANQLRQETLQTAALAPSMTPIPTAIVPNAAPPSSFAPTPAPTPLPPTTFAPDATTPPFGASPAPFSPPTLPTETPGTFTPQPGSRQQGPPIVSPPLR